jgi:hypothetical protein
MARIARFRRTLTFVCAVLGASLLAGAGVAAPALSLSLPLETPSVSVQTPSVSVSVSTPPVKAPTPPVRTPTAPVSPPKVPVKTHTITVTTPAVPAKPTTTTAAKAPSAPVKVPSVTTRTPRVAVKARAVQASTPAGSVGAEGGAVGATPGSLSTSSGAGRRPSSPTGSAPGDSAVATPASPSSATSGASGMSTAPLQTYGGAGAGYEEPLPQGVSRTVQARIARRERALQTTVERFHGCLNALPAGQRELLELRTGDGDGKRLDPSAAAARLHVATARIGRLEARAVRELREAAGAHGCNQAGEVVSGVMSLIGTKFGGEEARAAGGVEAVSYISQPVKPSPGSSSTLGRVLGADISPVASDLILILLMLAGLGMAVLLVVADAAGQGPRHEQWRQRVVNRLRSLR